jgi:hypothetical protein
VFVSYEVQQYTFCQGWINTWTTLDEAMPERPTTFETATCAALSLAEYLADELREFQAGNIASPSDPSDFRIVEVA